MRPNTAEDVKKGGCKVCNSPLTIEARKKAATRRIRKAEALIYKATEILQKAQSEISVICAGLNQNWSKIGDIREKAKEQMYNLERCRETGNCLIDETTRR